MHQLICTSKKQRAWHFNPACLRSKQLRRIMSQLNTQEFCQLPADTNFDHHKVAANPLTCTLRRSRKAARRWSSLKESGGIKGAFCCWTLQGGDDGMCSAPAHWITGTWGGWCRLRGGGAYLRTHQSDAIWSYAVSFPRWHKPYFVINGQCHSERRRGVTAPRCL